MSRYDHLQASGEICGVLRGCEAPYVPDVSSGVVVLLQGHNDPGLSVNAMFQLPMRT